MQSASSTASRSIWISRPWIDLLIGCGGWSLPLLAVSYVLTGDAAREWSAAFYSLALVSNYPHYMATVYRAYGRDDRAAHQLYTIYGTSVLIALAAVAHVQLWLVPWLFTAYVMWSPWHYSGQNFGLLLMFLRRAGVTVTTIDRRRLHLAFVASYVMLLAAFNQGASTDPLVLSLGIPEDVTTLVTSASAVVFVVVGTSAFISLARRASWRDLKAPAVLYATQALWFVVPTALASVSGIAIPQTRYSSGVLAVMHAAQYLWITQYFARREQGASWAAGRYWAAVIVGGMALFLPVPWIASYGAHIDFTASMLIVASVVNLHHFMLDGVVWKLRDKRVGQTLADAPSTVPLAASAPPAPPAPLAPPAPPAPSAPSAPSASLAPWLRRWGLTSAVLALAMLAGLDQWRYRLASRDGDRSSLQAAISLNPFDNNLQMRLFRLLMADERTDEARAQLDRLLAVSPRDVDLLVNAGVLARRTNRQDEAATFWRRALDENPSLAHVQLYLAELFDDRGRTADALDHYRRYLELTVQQRDRLRPDPTIVVPIVLKFADALSRTGHAAEARTQFELALKMSQQTKLADLERLARERLTSLTP